jgi:hypothetical protein
LANFFGGIAPMEIEVLAKARFFNDFLSARVYKELTGLKHKNGDRVFDIVRVYRDKDQIQDQYQSFSSYSTGDDTSDEQCFKVFLEGPKGSFTFKITKVADSVTLKSLRSNQVWDQAHFFECPSCSSHYGMAKDGIIPSKKGLPSNLFPTGLKGPLIPSLMSEVLKIVELKLACNYDFIPNRLLNDIRCNISEIWENSNLQWKTERKAVKKWINHYFQKADFYTVSKDLINLNLGFCLSDQSGLKNLVEERIDPRLELLEKLIELIDRYPQFDCLLYKLVGFLFCLVGNDPRFLSVEETECFEKMMGFFLVSDQETKLDDKLEACKKGNAQGSNLEFMLRWLFEEGFQADVTFGNVLGQPSYANSNQEDNSILAENDHSILAENDHSILAENDHSILAENDHSIHGNLQNISLSMITYKEEEFSVDNIQVG